MKKLKLQNLLTIIEIYSHVGIMLIIILAFTTKELVDGYTYLMLAMYFGGLILVELKRQNLKKDNNENKKVNDNKVNNNSK